MIISKKTILKKIIWGSKKKVNSALQWPSFPFFQEPESVCVCVCKCYMEYKYMYNILIHIYDYIHMT